MASVTFPPDVGGDGSTVSDDANPQTGLANGGHRTRFVPALGQLVAVAQWVVTKAQEVASLALNILNAPATSATSLSSLTLANSGTISFTLDQMDKAFMAGMTVGFARQSNPQQQMIVVLDTFNPATGQGTGTIISATATGGPYSGWNVFRTASGGIPATRSFMFNFGDSLIGAGTLAADIVINLGRAVAADIAAGVDNLKAVTAKALKDALKPQELTDQATIQWDWGVRDTAKVTLGGNRTLGKPTNYQLGDTKYLFVRQDTTGGRTLALHACYQPGAKPPLSVSTGAGKLTLVTIVCVDDDATNPVFRYSYDLDAP
jgi:hypothetical protein